MTRKHSTEFIFQLLKRRKHWPNSLLSQKLSSIHCNLCKPFEEIEVVESLISISFYFNSRECIREYLLLFLHSFSEPLLLILSFKWQSLSYCYTSIILDPHLVLFDLRIVCLSGSHCLFREQKLLSWSCVPSWCRGESPTLWEGGWQLYEKCKDQARGVECWHL